MSIWARDAYGIRPKDRGLKYFAPRGIASLVALAAGAATAWKPLPALLLTLFLTLGLVLVIVLLKGGRTRSKATGLQSRFIPVLLFLYLFPLMSLGKVYASIGVNPIYLPDILLSIAAVFAAFQARWRHIAIFTLCCVAVSVLSLHAVVVGSENHYAGATKGLVLALYPLLAGPLAGWLSSRSDLDQLLASFSKYVLPWIPLGLVLTYGSALVPSSYGLYLGCAGAFAAVAGVPRRRLIGISFAFGGVLLIVLSAKRGVALTMMGAFGVAWIAQRRVRSFGAKEVIKLVIVALVGVLSVSAFLGFIRLGNVPGLGTFISRASGQSLSASNNVAVREQIWAYALSTSLHEDALFGVGAYHPILVDFDGNNFADQPLVGVHDSFIGYTFYAGYPAGILVASLFLGGVIRLWRVRHRNLYVPALLGCLVAAIITALTNVALEVTYIGGLSWLILAAAFGVSARCLDERADGRDQMSNKYDGVTGMTS